MGSLPQAAGADDGPAIDRDQIAAWLGSRRRDEGGGMSMVTGLRERAIAAHRRRAEEQKRAWEAEARRKGAILADLLRDRLDVALDAPPAGPVMDLDGIRFWAVHDPDRGYPESASAYRLEAAAILADDEYGSRTGPACRIANIEDLGALLIRED